MKFSYQLTSAVVAAFFLSACAESPMERNQAKDDFAYLETPAFSQWQSQTMLSHNSIVNM